MEAAVNAGLVAASIVLYRISLGFPLGSGIFPRVLLLSLLLLCGANLVRLARSGPMRRRTGPARGPLSPDRLTPLAQYLAIVLYVLAIHRLGFFTSTAAFVVGSMALLGARGRSAYALTTLALVAALYVIFVLQFRVPLPRGALL